MAAATYKLWSVGNPVGEGVTGSIRVGMAGIAKKATATEPYIVFNELLCSLIARVLMLPAPRGAIMEHGGDQYFFSLDFNTAGHSLPPASPAAIISHDACAAWGVILLDVLMLNTDRHRKNIAFDTLTNRLSIFDHSHAFAGPSGDITARLASMKGKIMLGAQCLAPEINTEDGLDHWCDRIRHIPDYFVRDAFSAAVDVGLPASEKAACGDFLLDRRDNLRSLVEANRPLFPKLPKVAHVS